MNYAALQEQRRFIDGQDQLQLETIKHDKYFINKSGCLN
jgi:hypothetical protein